jgi:hypothetical protein
MSRADGDPPRTRISFFARRCPSTGQKRKLPRWVATAATSPHVAGDAVDIGHLDAAPGRLSTAPSMGCTRSTGTSRGTTNCVLRPWIARALPYIRTHARSEAEAMTGRVERDDRSGRPKSVAPMGGGRDPRGAMDVDADVDGGRQRSFTRVKTDAHLDLGPSRPCSGAIARCTRTAASPASPAVPETAKNESPRCQPRCPLRRRPFGSGRDAVRAAHRSPTRVP